ncbi:MAG TPA: AraC family transcriptional regulator [Gemmatirosa sp.]|nr:AraC family transcriptional regulator [Gemmatirosa sp.]
MRPPADDLAYAETAPPAPLASAVAAIWSHGRRADAPGDGIVRILPDGSADLVLGLARVGPPAAAPLALAHVWVVGAMTGARLVHVGAYDAHVGVRLRPEAARRVLDVAAHALVDGSVPLAELWPDAEGLLAALHRVHDLAAARAQVAAALVPRLAPLAPPADVAHAVHAIEASRGRVRVDEVSRALGRSRQHLARRFAQHVGVTPKMLARIARLRALGAALDVLERQGARVRWSALAHVHGYADQPHLADEVRALTGLTPTAWRRERRAGAVPFSQDAAAVRG